MKPSVMILLGCAVALGAFGYWGAFTKSGNRQFDEMSGMIPYFALLVGAALAVCAAAVAWFTRK